MQKSKTSNKFYLIWAILFSVFPIIVSILDLISISLNIDILLLVCFFVFSISALCRLFLLLKKDYKNTTNSIKSFFPALIKSPVKIVIFICFLLVLISSFVNGVNSHTFIFCSYFIILLCFFKTTKDQHNLIINLLLISTTICCLMGFIDPTGEKLPGFNPKQMDLSLQFYNPNHSSYVMATMIILSIGMLQKSKALILEILYILMSFVYATFIFMNGSFAGIVIMFASIFIMIVFYIIRFKKFPLKMFISLVFIILISLLIEFVPNINDYRTTPYNYIIETIDAINHYFKTEIPIPKLWGATKEYLTKASTSDAYTFTERERLLTSSQEAMLDTPKTILFGYGAGAYSNFTPHNMFLSLALEFGIGVPICIFAVMILCFYKFIKNKACHSLYFVIFSVVCFVLCGLTGSLVSYSAIYLFILLGLGFRIVKNENN